MAVFEEVKLTWKGREYSIPPDQVLRLIAKVEDIIPFAELASISPRKVPFARIAAAYGAMLRHAGAAVTDEEVYEGMWAGGGKDLKRLAVTAVLTLQALMVPPAALREQATKAKKDAATSGRADSSRRRTSS